MAHSSKKSLLRIAVLAVSACLLWLGWYGAKKGLTRTWRERVFKEFRKHGIEVSFKRLTANPWRGFVASEVQLFESSDRKKVLATVDQITLSVDFGRLIRKRNFLSALELRDARLSLPLEPRNPSSKRLEVQNLNARLLLPAHQIRLLYADAKILGLRIRAQGSLANPDKIQNSGQSTEFKLPETVFRALEELEKVEFLDDAGILKIDFKGDLSAPEGMQCTARFNAAELRIREIAIDDVECTVHWRNHALEIEEISISDPRGALRSVGLWDPANGNLHFQVESTLDPILIAKGFGFSHESISHLAFVKRPSISANLQRDSTRTPPLRVTGAISSGSFSLNEEHFDSLSGTFALSEGNWSIQDLVVAHSRDFFKLNALKTAEGFNVNLYSTLKWQHAMTAVPVHWRTDRLSWLHTEESPLVELEAAGTSLKWDECSVWGKIVLGRSEFRGIPLVKAEVPVLFHAGQLGLGPFLLQRPEGRGEGSVTYDILNNDIYFHDLKLRLNPVETMRMIEPDWVDEVLPYRFKGPPPFISIKGRAAPRTRIRTFLDLKVESEGPMEYTFAGKDLIYDKVSASLSFIQTKLLIKQLGGPMFGGRLDGNAEVSLNPENPVHRASLKITDMNFATISRLYTGYDDSKGRLNTNFLWRGESDNGRRVHGSGELSITDGNVFAIPFLGPLSTALGHVIPGLGYSMAHKATASFTVKNGTFNTQNLKIEGLGFNLLGHGDLHFMDDAMRFYARINARGVPGMVLFPVSRLLEYSSEGKLSKPDWKPRILPNLPKSNSSSGSGEEGNGPPKNEPE